MAIMIEKRKAVTNMYPGKKAWAIKVSKMPDEQVHEIYMRLKKEQEEKVAQLKAEIHKNETGQLKLDI